MIVAAPLEERSLPSWCCQRCGENIGWMGRFLFPFFHECDMKPEFYVGQRVRRVKDGLSGVVLKVVDLSDVITHDDPRTRNFALRVQLDERSYPVSSNGAYWERE